MSKEINTETVCQKARRIILNEQDRMEFQNSCHLSIKDEISCGVLFDFANNMYSRGCVCGCYDDLMLSILDTFLVKKTFVLVERNNDKNKKNPLIFRLSDKALSCSFGESGYEVKRFIKETKNTYK